MTANQQALETITRWFQTASCGSLLLPDGWFGRPYDNQHRLTYATARAHKVIVELDDQLLLVFTELSSVRIESSDLVLAGFAQCVFDWQGFGDLEPHVRVYRDGEVRLVPPLGARSA